MPRRRLSRIWNTAATVVAQDIVRQACRATPAGGRMIETMEGRYLLAAVGVVQVADAAEPNTPGSFTLTRGGSTASDLVVNVTVAGTATRGTDYTLSANSAAVNGSTVTIPTGSRSVTVVVTPINDTVSEGNETVLLTIAAPTNVGDYTISPLQTNATVNIVDDEPTLTVTNPFPLLTVGEGSNNGTFRITRTGSTVLPQDVSFTLTGSAALGSDFTLQVNGQTISGNHVTIPATQSFVDVTLNVLDNAVAEPTETATLTVIGTNTIAAVAPSSVTIKIHDDDGVNPPHINPATPISTNKGNSGTGTFASSDPDVSADGRYVTFLTNSTNIVSSPLTTFVQVYRRDLVAKKTVLVSISADLKTEGNADAVAAVISADGRYVAFETNATNIVSGRTDSNIAADVYLKDMDTGKVTLVTRDSSGAVGGKVVDISADGRLVLFETSTEGSKFVKGLKDTNAADDLFTYSRADGKYQIVTASAGNKGTGNRGTIANQATGSFLTAPVDPSTTTPVIQIDPFTGLPAIFTPAATVQENAGAGAGKASFSGDGNFVLFPSRASNLVSGMTDGNSFQYDLFVRDLKNKTTDYVSVGTGANKSGNDDSGDAQISDDGRYVAYRSNATNLVANDKNAASDVFLRDRRNGTTTLISAKSTGLSPVNGITGAGDSTNPVMTPDGRYIAFSSDAPDIVDTTLDNNGESDVFRYDTKTGKMRLVSINNPGTHSAGGLSTDPSISSDGSLVLFTSNASDLPGDVDKIDNSTLTVYVRNVDTRRSRVVSLESNGKVSITADAADATLSGDGSRVVFESYGDSFTTNDANGALDLFTVETPGNEASRLVVDAANARDTIVGNDDDGTLYITGSTLPDSISVQRSGASKLIVRRNGVETTYRFSNIEAIKISGGDGNDSISIGTSVIGASIDGGDGNDTIIGGGGNDTIHGGDGRDSIVGNGGDDSLFGDKGSDTLFGGAGNDHLDGGPSADTLNGGEGTDTVDNNDANDILTSTEA